MDSDELEAPKKPVNPFEEVLDAYSVHELEERIVLLEAEIVKCKALIEAKRQSKASADSVFSQ